MTRTIRTGDRVLVRGDDGQFVDCDAIVTSRNPKKQAADVSYTYQGKPHNGRFGVYDLQRKRPTASEQNPSYRSAMVGSGRGRILP